MLKMACLFSMILSAQAVRFDGKAELASLSALISKLKLKNPAAAAGGRIENTTSTGSILTETGESTDVLTTIREILSDIEKSINAAKTEKATTHLEQCTDKVGDANTVAEEDDTVDVHLKNLVGCEQNSQCETNTNTHQQAATAARNQISQHTADLAVWNPQVGPLESNNQTQHNTKDACSQSLSDNQPLHEERLQTFVDAIAVLTKIKDSLNAETGAISTPQLITEKEKTMLGDFKVAKTMLLILNSSQSALADPDLVSTLKNLLISCISSLQTSHQNEIDDHDNWVSVKNLCITTADGEITTLSQSLTDLRGKIANANTQIALETSNLNNAESASDTLRGACIQGNTDFLASMSTFEQELNAIGDMNVILDNSGLGDTTIAVRDETDQTKHGVHESINTGTDLSVFKDSGTYNGLTGFIMFNWADSGASYPAGADPFGEDLGSGGCTQGSPICRGKIPTSASPSHLLSKNSNGNWALFAFDGSTKSNKILQAMQQHQHVCSPSGDGAWQPIASSGVTVCNGQCNVFSYNTDISKCPRGGSIQGSGGSYILDDDGHWCHPAFKMGATVNSGINNDYGWANVGCGTKVGGGLYYLPG